MNSRNAITGLLFCLFFSACQGEDRRKEYEAYTEVQKWMENVMRENYYWYQDMPDVNKLNFFTEPKAFFRSLLSENDGKQKNGSHYYYSVLENLEEMNTRSIQQTDYSYGFEFRVYHIIDLAQSLYAALVLYVVPNSPADKTGLKRGQWIFEINDTPVSEENYTILYGSEAAILGVSERYTGGFLPIKKYFIEAACEIDDNPVHYHTVYPSNDPGKRIGYLVYNHFTAGKTDEDQTYDNNLRNVSREFKHEGVNEFILDLRYNNGGLLSSAELLCAILAPEPALGKILGYIEYNDKHNPQIYNMTLDTGILGGGVNLNLNTLYVLTSEASASASELIINCLSPYMKVVLIGTQTEGKNVGSITYKNEELNWELRPIVCKIYNSENKSDYVNGFTPHYKIDESSDMGIDYFLEFGNPDELLLNKALQLISGTDGAEEEEDILTSRSLTRESIPVYCSLDRKATNGVIIQ
jgi:C-terminal processing protease CtpA/Prc